jgi:hypothetical protein
MGLGDLNDLCEHGAGNTGSFVVSKSSSNPIGLLHDSQSEGLKTRDNICKLAWVRIPADTHAQYLEMLGNQSLYQAHRTRGL